MNRRYFTQAILGSTLVGGLSLLTTKTQANKDMKAPALFLGHGDPTNVLHNNKFTRDWDRIGAALPKPAAILMVSAHWETQDIAVAVTPNPQMIYDFYGFPEKMYQLNYPAPGSPTMAHASVKALRPILVREDHKQGLDHGAWCILARLFPKADVPVFQFSLSRSMSPIQHYELAKQLKSLRDQGVMIIGSGNITHNMRSWQKDAATGRTHIVHDWAQSFDEKVVELIDDRNHQAIAEYQRLGSEARMSIPTPEHFLPLLYTLAVTDKDERPQYFSEGFEEGSFSMRSVQFG